MHTVTFYSYKGGVGRTLVVANVAKYLARMGMKVFVLDFDLEAPGIHYKFESEPGKALKVEKGLIDILSAFTTTRMLPEPLTDYVVEVASPTFATGTIHLLPAGDAPSSAYWKSLSKVDWHTLFYAEGAEGIPLFLEIKAFIEEKYAPDFVLIDARTGITEMGGVATTVLSDQVVCLMLPSREHLDGTRQVMHAIRAAARTHDDAQIGLLAVLSRMPNREAADEVAEVDRVKQFLNAPIDDIGSSLGIEDLSVLHRDPVLEEREHILVGSNRTLDDSLLLQDYVRLFVKLVPSQEIEKYVGQLVQDIEKRIMQTPDEAEQALEALAKDCLHPEAYRALLAVYRLRRSPISKSLQAAYTFWRLTDNVNDPLLWDAVKDYKRPRYGMEVDVELDADHLNCIEAIWRAQRPDDSPMALVLAHDYVAADLHSRAVDVLEVNASTDVASSGAVVRLIRLRCEDGNLGHADRVILRYKERMAASPPFLEAWVERALTSESSEELQTVLDDAHFDLAVIDEKVPALGARLWLFKTGDSVTAKAFLLKANLKAEDSIRRKRSDLAQLGALARDLGNLDAFKSRLKKELPHYLALTVQEIEWLHPLPAVPDAVDVIDSDDRDL